MAEQRLRFMQDGDFHWYVVPAEMAKQFEKLGERGDDEAVYEFIDKFDRYRLEMHPSNYTFTDLQEA